MAEVGSPQVVENDGFYDRRKCHEVGLTALIFVPCLGFIYK